MYLQLRGGCYTVEGSIANQRQVNLYVENIPVENDEPFSLVNNPTPGLTLLSQAPGGIAPYRGLYPASNGKLYAVVGNKLYYINNSWVFNLVGTMHPSAPSDGAQRFNPVSMSDNGTDLIIVDGSIDGWTCNVVSASDFARIDSNNQTVTGTVKNPVVASNTTVIIDTIPVTLGLTDTSLSATVASINAANITNITAVETSSNYLQIRDSTGTAIIIGPGSANAALGLTDGYYGVPDPGGFVGGNKIDFTDTYFVTSQPNSTLFYCSQADSTLFDALDFVNRSAKSDPLQAVIVTHRTILLLGTQTTEIWWNGGPVTSGVLAGNTFPFQEFPNTLIQKGLLAIYSLAQQDNIVYFLGTDVTGSRIVYACNNGNIDRISTFSIEYEIGQYLDVTGATGSCYQQKGHKFYVLNFPLCSDGSGDATWVFDATTSMWHERVYIDSSGEEHRWRGDFICQAYGKIVCADFENSNLYALDLNNQTDNGQPIKRVRMFPHQIDPEQNRRVIFNQFIANMQVGSALSSGSGVQTCVAANFTAPNGTPITDYTGSIGGGYSAIPGNTTEGIIFDDAFTGNTVGTAIYSSNAAITSADYTVSFTLTPESYTTIANTTIFAVARALSNSTVNSVMGYQAAVAGTDGGYILQLSVRPAGQSVELPMGDLTNGVYDVTMSLNGNYISVAVNRSGDGLWMNQFGGWQPTPVTALGISDSTYTAAGEVLIGGNWSNNVLNIPSLYNISYYNTFGVYS